MDVYDMMKIEGEHDIDRRDDNVWDYRHKYGFHILVAAVVGSTAEKFGLGRVTSCHWNEHHKRHVSEGIGVLFHYAYIFVTNGIIGGYQSSPREIAKQTPQRPPDIVPLHPPPHTIQVGKGYLSRLVTRKLVAGLLSVPSSQKP